MHPLCNKLTNEIIYSGQILSLGTVSLVGASLLVSGLEINWIFLLLIYFGAHSIYLFDRYRDIATDSNSNKDRVSFFKNNRVKISFQLYLFVIGIIIILLFSHNILFIIFTLFTYLIGFAYNLLFKKLTKYIPGFKNFFVAFNYALLIIMAGFFYKIYLSPPILLFALFVFLRLFVAVAFYDLKDKKDDKMNGIYTLAVIMNATSFNATLHVVNLLSSLPIIIGVVLGHFPAYTILLLLVIPYFWIYQRQSKRAKDLSLFSYLFCDGEYLIWLPLVILAKYLWN